MNMPPTVPPGANVPSMTTPSAPTPGPSISAAEAVGGTAPAGGGSDVASAAPNMIGDFLGGSIARLRVASNVYRPIANRGGMKISENESPRPVDRVFVNYNYFNNVSLFPAGGSPAGSGSSFNLHRETFGFEKTFLDGDGSFGVRLPVLQSDSLANSTVDGFGDLTLIFKYALVNDCRTGDVLSAGMCVTLPTGRNVILEDGHHLDSVLFQPWGGFVYSVDRLYSIGFAGVVIPTDSRDASFMFFDLGLGYRLYQACDDNHVLTQVLPTVEFHSTIPLNHNGLDSGGDIVITNQFVMTAGVHIGLWNCTYLTVAGAIPVAGPRLFNYEILTSLNIRF
jgi:hypothetical protein